MNFQTISNLLQRAKSIHSVADAGKQALLELEKRDPASARMLCKMIYNHEDPKKALQQYAQSDGASAQNLSKIKDGYAMLKRLGLKLDIPESAWQETQQALQQNTFNNIPRKGF